MSTRHLTASLLSSYTMFDRVDDRSPGPAAYDTYYSSLSKQGFTLSARHKDLKQVSVVSPNQYTIDTAKPFMSKYLPSFSMRSRVGGGIFDKGSSKTSEFPGPADHSYMSSSMSSMGCRIGTRTKEIDKRIILSPTKYNALPAFHRLSKSDVSYSLRSRVYGAFDLTHDEVDSPGPCKNSYNLMTLKQSGTKFPRSKTRFSINSPAAPPVGTYNIGGKQLGWTNTPEFTLRGRCAYGSTLFE